MRNNPRQRVLRDTTRNKNVASIQNLPAVFETAAAYHADAAANVASIPSWSNPSLPLPQWPSRSYSQPPRRRVGPNGLALWTGGGNIPNLGYSDRMHHRLRFGVAQAYGGTNGDCPKPTRRHAQTKTTVSRCVWGGCSGEGGEPMAGQLTHLNFTTLDV